jgi:HEAT repeat-containing protein 5
MYSSMEGNLAINEVESIVNLCTKSLETSDQVTRHALSRLVGHVLCSTQNERVPVTSDTSQKGKKDQGEDEDDVSAPAHILAEGKKTMLTTREMLCLLSVHFNKPNLSRKCRIGIFDFYVALLTKLGSSFVENNYALIISHLMTEIISNPRNSTTRYETLLVRGLVGILLRDLIGVRMLSEQGQIGAIQELSNSYLKRWPVMMPGQVSPSPLVLAIVLKEVAELLQQLGNAPPPVQVCTNLKTIP